MGPLHKMRLNDQAFSDIKNGRKQIESRLYDEKRQKISISDRIEFSRASGIGEPFIVKVVELLHYDTFEQLFGSVDTELFAGSSEKELLANIYKYYPASEENKHGVVGIRFEVIH